MNITYTEHMLTELTWNHIAVLNIIARNANKQTHATVLSSSILTKATGLSPRTMVRVLKSLEDLGYIERKILHGVMPTRYRLTAKACEMLYT